MAPQEHSYEDHSEDPEEPEESRLSPIQWCSPNIHSSSSFRATAESRTGQNSNERRSRAVRDLTATLSLKKTLRQDPDGVEKEPGYASMGPEGRGTFPKTALTRNGRSLICSGRSGRSRGDSGDLGFLKKPDCTGRVIRRCDNAGVLCVEPRWILAVGLGDPSAGDHPWIEGRAVPSR